MGERVSGDRLAGSMITLMLCQEQGSQARKETLTHKAISFYLEIHT